MNSFQGDIQLFKTINRRYQERKGVRRNEEKKEKRKKKKKLISPLLYHTEIPPLLSQLQAKHPLHLPTPPTQLPQEHLCRRMHIAMHQITYFLHHTRIQVKNPKLSLKIINNNLSSK